MTPTYNHLHAGHDRTDPRYAEVGFDVVRSSRLTDGRLLLEVDAVVDGAINYVRALDRAKALRTGGAWGYPAERYACGCRWIAVGLGGGVEFVDLPAVTVGASR